MDFRLLDGDAHAFRPDKTTEIEVAYETIVVLMVLVRQFVLGIGSGVVAFWRPEFFDNMFNGMHRLEHDREKHGRDGEKVEYGEFWFHKGKSRFTEILNGWF